MSNESELIAALTLKDKLNTPYLLGNQILTIQKAILSDGNSKESVREAIEGLADLIPVAWEDDQFKDDLKKAIVIERRDVRPIVAGNVRAGEEICKKLGLPIFEETETFDSHKKLHAVVNLLNRRGLYSREEKTEIIDGVFTDGKPSP